MDNNKALGSLPLPGIALALLMVGVIILSDNPFKPTRPGTGADVGSNAEDVRARLWQDPFEAVGQHIKEMHPESAKQGSEATFYMGNHRICRFDDTGQTYDAVHWQDAPLQTIAHSIDELRCQIQRDTISVDGEPPRVHVLAVMVPGGPYAEDHEVRIRSRYAVITGLSQGGYIPRDSEHIGYINLYNSCADKPIKDCDKSGIIPYEWFETNAQALQGAQGHYAHSVLVFWLNDAEISQHNPLSNLSALKSEISPGPHENHVYMQSDSGRPQLKPLVRLKFDVIGPAGSTTLVKMFQEAIAQEPAREFSNACNEESNSDEDCIRIISPRATIDYPAIATLLNVDANSIDGRILGRFNADYNTEVDNYNRVNRFELIRTIPTDAELVDEILCQLLYRGVNPFGEYTKTDDVPELCQTKAVKLKGKKLEFGERHRMLLIGEWDTAYSRNLNILFRDKLANGETGAMPDWLHSFNYLRGIDGSSGSGDKESKSEDEKKNGKKVFRRPIGPNQFDYLRRLGDKLTRFSDTLDRGDQVRAIGILGSDTYDKLLILQALRNRFPEAIFFTTDLDARLLHPDENKWARNLVVASGYGFSPPSDFIDDKILPFRDGYQTATYLSVYSATQKDSGVYVPGNTFAYEIGNSAAIDYSASKLSTENEPIDSKQKTARNLVYIVLPLLLFLFLVYQSGNSGVKYILVFFAFIACIVLWLIAINATSSIEYQHKFSGTSIWPAVVMRMSAGLIALFSIFYALIRLRNNTNSIIEKNNLPFQRRHRLSERLCDRFKSLAPSLSSIQGFLKSIYYEIVTSLAWIARNKYIDSDTVRKRGYEMPNIWSCLLISVWGWRYDLDKRIGIDELMYQYMELGRTRWWLLRVILMLLMYVVVVYLLMGAFGTARPVTFFTGDISQAATKPVIFPAVISYLFLVFLVVDVTRLNSRFVELLSRCKLDWPENIMTKYCNEFGINKQVAVEKLKLDLIVLRSKAVDVLIFLPFIVLSLLILSRSNYFEHWHTPAILVIVIMFGAGIALSSAFRLRRSAAKARSHVLDRLEQILRLHQYKECKLDLAGHDIDTSSERSDAAILEHKMSGRLRDMIEDIRKIKAGPFLPIARHPIISAIAMPFGGVGGLYLIDYFTSVGV